jgi:1-aminocyclopropane-1-carboxylate synthase
MLVPSPTEPTRPKIPGHEQPNGMGHLGGLISLSSENASLMTKELSEYLGANMHIHPEVLENGVPPGTVAESLVKVYSAPPFSAIEPLGNENLYYVDGHSELLERIVWAICDEAEGVLASRPCDLRFIKTMGERCKVRSLLVNLDRVDPFSGQAVKLFENEAVKAQANGTRVRALILTQPHSPPGTYSHLLIVSHDRFYPREVLVEYMALCQRLGIHLVVDETYAMTTYASDDLLDPIPFTSVLSIDKTDLIDLDLCHAVHAIGKVRSLWEVI